MDKACGRCKVTKSATEFYVKPRYRQGLSSWCKSCESDYRRERRKVMTPEQRERERELARARGPRPADQIRRHRMWTWHRMTPEAFDVLLERQGGKCAIPACSATEPGGNGDWHIDHDHSCCPGSKSCGSCVRGLLCARCNPMLGFARDDREILRSAADYLDFNALQTALGPIGG